MSEQMAAYTRSYPRTYLMKFRAGASNVLSNNFIVGALLVLGVVLVARMLAPRAKSSAK